jgi:hypothetical protein
MPEEYTPSNEEERLQAENDFLKMKLMLERDAYFDMCSQGDVPARIENEFLKNVIEFEKQFEERRTTSIFDKIGRPDQFKPVTEIPDEQIDISWKRLDEFLNNHGIDLDVCSPNISNRELYRFTIEELFPYEVDDINIPGMIQGFIYDEFHPDHIYDNTRHAIEDCMRHILKKEPIEWFYCFQDGQLKLNGHYPLTIVQFKEKVNLFKAAYDNLEIKEIESTKCSIEKTDCWVTGKYSVDAIAGIAKYSLSGNWNVYFKQDEELGYWNIAGIEIEGINF